MNFCRLLRIPLLFWLFTTNLILFAQEQTSHEKEEPVHKSKFLTGLYLSSYFANNHSAATYNGYGFDIDGNQNTFFNSLMYQKIVNEYGGGYGQHDQIADAIGVDQHQWTFTESDMPYNMRYQPAIMVGVNFKIPVDKKSFILVNINGTKLNIEGAFTINTIKPGNPNPAVNTTLLYFPIKGTEQRLQFQLGFQHLFGEDENLNFFLEAGLMGTLAKVDKNIIYINDLTIDLNYYVNQTSNPAPYPGRKPVGFGLGAFAGAGINIDTSPKFNVQLLYTPSLEKINIGNNVAVKLQHSIGVRFYYKF